MRVGLVGCVKSKRPFTVAARDLYCSPLFLGRRRYVERSCDAWYILSAEHGLVAPSTPLAPYDNTLKSMSVVQRQAWAARVLDALDSALGNVSGTTFEMHAGSEYRDDGLVAGLEARGALVENPTAGLSFGAQLRFYVGQ